MLRAVFRQPGLAGDLCGSENLASASAPPYGTRIAMAPDGIG
jgi:hypothetical protein